MSCDARLDDVGPFQSSRWTHSRIFHAIIKYCCTEILDRKHFFFQRLSYGFFLQLCNSLFFTRSRNPLTELNSIQFHSFLFWNVADSLLIYNFMWYIFSEQWWFNAFEVRRLVQGIFKVNGNSCEQIPNCFAICFQVMLSKMWARRMCNMKAIVLRNCHYIQSNRPIVTFEIKMWKDDKPLH